jgi:hypothetical protein
MLPILFITLVCMHPVHASLSEVQWNDEKKCLEVSLRLSPEDANWILKSSQAAREVATQPHALTADMPGGNSERRDESNDPDSVPALAYLRHHYRIEPPPESGKDDPTLYRWIGREDAAGHQWWHFEMVPSRPVPPQHWSVSMLLDRGPEYQHRVVVLGHEPPTSMDFSRQQTRLSIQTWNNPTSAPKPSPSDESLAPK